MNTRQLDVDGLKVEVYEPDGPSKARLLFSHGAWVGGWIWETFAPWFAENGYTAFVPTWRGRYDSRPNIDLGKVSVLDFVEDCLAVAAATSPDVLIGESAGGLIAQKAAESLKDLKALVLMNSAPPFMVPASPVVTIRQIKYLGDILLGRPNKPSFADYKALILNNVGDKESHEMYARICPESGTALREMSFGKIKVDPNKINCAVCVVVGHLDTILPLKVHRKIARLYGAELLEYPKMSHHTFSEQGWQEVASEVSGWIAKTLEQRVT